MHQSKAASAVMTTRQGHPAVNNAHIAESVPACPGCGSRDWVDYLQAPDRYHGRKEVYRLVCCKECSLVWLGNPPRPDQMGTHYTDEYYRAVTKAGETSPKRWRTHFDHILRYKNCGALLDLGCSSGGFLEVLKETSWQLSGIELCAASARRAEARTGARVFVGDILDAPFAACSFDVITCFDVLEHLYEPRRVMAKVWEWLRPGGVFYTQVPNIDSAEARLFRSYWYTLELPRHLSHFSPRSLSYLARSVGFEEVSLVALRNSAFECSIRYMCDALLEGAGIVRTPPATARDAGFVWKVIRKAFRMTVLKLFHGTVLLAGDGEAIHAVYRKKAS